MSNVGKLPEHMVFGLDIGTRSIVGSVGYMDRNKFKVVAHFVKEHETRAMMDGQIHDISMVGNTIDDVKRELENQIGRPLKEVCIAAAGRVLKTLNVHIDFERDTDLPITSEDVYALESLGIDKAYDEIRQMYSDTSFYCVGYSVIKYYMNDYYINNLEGHKAKKIGADILATFLPNDVIEGLYSAVSIAELEVASLTLEPIAAINIAIPEHFRLLNIALVDVGAGTSDISITKDGSIIAYGMIPHAGDEITEAIAHKCLVDFNNAEEIKRASILDDDITYTDILGLPNTVTSKKVRSIYSEIVDNTTREIAEKIIELNGGKAVNAVFVVGGGGKAYGFTDKLAKYLNLPKERVALRGAEVLGDVDFLMDNVTKDPLLVTPIGICVNHYNQKNSFIYVTINDQKIKLYDNDKLTVVDAAAQVNFPNEELFPRRGASINYTINGVEKMIKGEIGEPAVILVNGELGNITTKIKKNDKIIITPSTLGEAAKYKVEQIPGFKSLIKFTVNGNSIECPKFVNVNNELVTGSYEIQDGDVIEILDSYTVEQIMTFMDMDFAQYDVTVNGHNAAIDEPVYEGFNITIKEKVTEPVVEEIIEEEVSEDVYEEEIIEEANEDADNNEDEVENSDSKSEEPVAVEETKASDKIYVIVNTQVINMSGKSSYIFVDILDYYPFDTKTAGGKEVVMTINGNTATFMDPVHDGDIIELYWS
ncbi:MAG: rod shape-determining protein [Lachnospiraceae bacterium]|nr:rod shape-determining protein [Lachnospiraceae bacterium]